MKTPVVINNVEIRAIVDTGAASSAISRRLLNEIGGEITESSNIRCVMANGSKTASLGRTEIDIEVQDIITPVKVEVIDSQDRSLLLGNNVLRDWNANIDFSTKTMTWEDEEIMLEIPVEYIKNPKVQFDVPEESESDSNYESDEEIEMINIMNLEEEVYSSDEEAK